MVASGQGTPGKEGSPKNPLDLRMADTPRNKRLMVEIHKLQNQINDINSTSDAVVLGGWRYSNTSPRTASLHKRKNALTDKLEWV